MFADLSLEKQILKDVAAGNLYAQHWSAVTDRQKLSASGFPGRIGIVIFAYEYVGWPDMVCHTSKVICSSLSVSGCGFAMCTARAFPAAHFGSIDPEVVYLLQRRKLQRHQSVAHCVHIKML